MKKVKKFSPAFLAAQLGRNNGVSFICDEDNFVTADQFTLPLWHTEHINDDYTLTVYRSGCYTISLNKKGPYEVSSTFLIRHLAGLIKVEIVFEPTDIPGLANGFIMAQVIGEGYVHFCNSFEGLLNWIDEQSNFSYLNAA